MKLFDPGLSVRCFASIAIILQIRNHCASSHVHEITNLNPNFSNCGRPALTFLGQINLDDVRIANSHGENKFAFMLDAGLYI